MEEEYIWKPPLEMSEMQHRKELYFCGADSSAFSVLWFFMFPEVNFLFENKFLMHILAL